ncbi:MAG: ATP synthase subunit I [Variovorax paradoxus]|uniref:ATP synthase subunit I n=1 Tax=Variovorax paradoxus TaxID=34073 RepID=A0A2W5PRT1_VARPD|nr:MAG: ATP synthase subunit I [Variovorax paradoxus]
MTTEAPVAEVSDFKPLTADEARRLREQHPELSPWWVIGAQVAAGLVVAMVAWAWTQTALFIRGTRPMHGVTSQSAAMLKFFVWELIKIALTVALLAAARWVISDLHWLALVAGVVVALKMYWVALVVRPRLLNRI